jgi:hypothetical protein
MRGASRPDRQVSCTRLGDVPGDLAYNAQRIGDEDVLKRPKLGCLRIVGHSV